MKRSVLVKILKIKYERIIAFLFAIMLVGALFIKAMYSFEDRPYFTSNTVMDWIFLIVNIVVYILFYRYRKELQRKFSLFAYSILFWGLSVSFIILVPEIPFSDMGGVYNGAVYISSFDIWGLYADSYFQTFPGNVRLSLFWSLFLFIFPKSIVTVRIINIAFLFLSSVLTMYIAKGIGLKYYKLSFIVMTFYASWIMYGGVVYYEGPVILLLMFAIYIYIYKRQFIVAMCFVGFAAYFRMISYIFAIAIICDYLINIKNEHQRNGIRRLLKGIIILLIISVVPGKLVMHYMVDENFREYPIWNQFYIGINESKIGFMDQDFSYSRSFMDIVNRIKEYGLLRLIKIVIKKTFWLWTQGTFQVQRYVFGNDSLCEEEKFYYHTFLTNHLLRDEQPLRTLINSFLRSQYIVSFAIVDFSIFYAERKSAMRIIINVIIITFFSLILYELKSRYIFHLIPLMAICIIDSMEKVEG